MYQVLSLLLPYAEFSFPNYILPKLNLDQQICLLMNMERHSQQHSSDSRIFDFPLDLRNSTISKLKCNRVLSRNCVWISIIAFPNTKHRDWTPISYNLRFHNLTSNWLVNTHKNSQSNRGYYKQRWTKNNRSITRCKWTNKTILMTKLTSCSRVVVVVLINKHTSAISLYYSLSIEH